MKISKLLEIATSKHKDFNQIYEAVKDTDTWEEIELGFEEKEKIRKAVKLVDEQTYELMVPPLKRLKSEAKRYTSMLHIENANKCNFDEPFSSLYFKISSKINSFAWFQLYYEYVSKEGPWGLGMAISITELNNMNQHQRKNLEKKLQEIIGNNWGTTEEWINSYKIMEILEEDIKEELEGDGGLRLKKPIALLAGDKISKIHECVVEIGHSSFIQIIPKLKEFWKNNF